MDSLSVIIPTVRSLIDPVLNVAYKKQQETADINLKKVPDYDSGLWHSTICVNAQTSIFHTEHDCTYTLIYVPSQEKKKGEKNGTKYHFIFKLKNKENIGIPMYEGITLLFSGKFLTHRQTCNKTCTPVEEVFANLTLCGSKRLYTHIKSSFRRNESI